MAGLAKARAELAALTKAGVRVAIGHIAWKQGDSILALRSVTRSGRTL
jgi:hypothetical protein